MSKQYTRSEVSSSRGKGQTMIILHDKVYDVTSFLNEHPGGEEILLDQGGKDGSENFDDVGHSKEAFELMKKFVVGELVELERSNKPPKLGWMTTGGGKAYAKEEDTGMSPFLVFAFAVVILSALYYVYL